MNEIQELGEILINLPQEVKSFSLTISTHNLPQERHPASRETRRLLKQRSQESVRSGERRSTTGSILGEDAGRRSVLGGDENRKSLPGGGGEEGRRSRLSEESRRSLVGDVGGGGRRETVGEEVGGGRQIGLVAFDDGKRIAPASSAIPELERSRGRGDERRMEAKQGQADNAHQRRLEVKQDVGRVDKKSTYERKVEERASTYLHWEETPSLPSPPATPPAEGE